MATLLWITIVHLGMIEKIIRTFLSLSHLWSSKAIKTRKILHLVQPIPTITITNKMRW